MDRKRTSTAPLLLENRATDSASPSDTLYLPFSPLDAKKWKPLTYASAADKYLISSIKDSLDHLWPGSPLLPAPQSDSQNDYRPESSDNYCSNFQNNCSQDGFSNKYELNGESVELPANSSPCTSQTRRAANFSDCNAADDVISIVDLADSPNSQTSYSSEEDSDMVIYEGTTRREPRVDGCVVCIDTDDQDTENSPQSSDQTEEDQLKYTDDIKPSNIGTQLPNRSQSAGKGRKLISNLHSPNHNQSTGKGRKLINNCSQSPKTMWKSSGKDHIFGKGNDSDSEKAEDWKAELLMMKKFESERVKVDNLKAELKVQKQNHEWQEAKIRYLETKLQERTDFEYKLAAVNQLNDMLEKKLSELEKSAANLPVFEKEMKRLREKIKLLEDDKRTKEELGQTISNLIDDKTNLKTEIESLTSIAGILEKESSTLKQKCETLEKAAANVINCTGRGGLQECMVRQRDAGTTHRSIGDRFVRSSNRGDNSTESCCLRMKHLRDKMTETLENEFKCSICEEMFIEATVTNCNHVFCGHCLSEWMKKKKDCPHCRKHVSQQCRAPVIDEFVLSVCKLLSEKMHTERLQVVQERKTQSSKKVPQSGSRKSASGVVRVVPIASLRMPPVPPPPPQRMPTANSLMRSINYWNPPPTPARNETARSYDSGFYNQPLFSGGPSSTATIPASPASPTEAAATLSTVPAPMQLHALDARIGRHQATSTQTSASASGSLSAASSMHVSSTSAGGSMAAAQQPLSRASATATAPSSTTSSTGSGYSWRDDLFGGYNSTSMYNASRPTISAVNPFSSMDDYASALTSLQTSSLNLASSSVAAANAFM